MVKIEEPENIDEGVYISNLINIIDKVIKLPKLTTKIRSFSFRKLLKNGTMGRVNVIVEYKSKLNKTIVTFEIIDDEK